jgi:nitroreductase/NAD-dependent dihydropyrimidine dehydrogenase PreA subunit
MSLISIDETRCTSCGLCSRACPVNIIVAGDRLPETVGKIEKGCITCGHCVAACPTAALSHCRMSLDDCMDLDRGWRLSPGQMEQLVKGRRSIRRYRPDPVDQGVLEKLLDIARYSPTGMNRQTVQWLVLRDPYDVEILSSIVIDWLRLLLAQGAPGVKGMLKSWELGNDPVMRKAPHLIIAYGGINDLMTRYSSIIALTTLELASVSFGLGACWAGFLYQAANSYAEVNDFLGLPPGFQVHGGLTIGYPEFEYSRIPARNQANVIWR